MPPSACTWAEKAPLSYLGTQCLHWAPTEHHHLKKKMGWVQQHHHFDCCFLVPGACAVPWCLLMLMCTLRRCPYNFLAPSQCLCWAPTKHHHPKKQKWGECNSTTIWLLFLCARCLRRCWEGALVPTPHNAKEGAPALSYSYSYKRARAGVKQMKQGGNWFSSFLFFPCVHFVVSEACPSQCERGGILHPFPVFGKSYHQRSNKIQSCWSAALCSSWAYSKIIKDEIRTMSPLFTVKKGSRQFLDTKMYQPSFLLVSVGKIPRQYQPKIPNW